MNQNKYRLTVIKANSRKAETEYQFKIYYKGKLRINGWGMEPYKTRAEALAEGENELKELMSRA